MAYADTRSNRSNRGRVPEPYTKSEGAAKTGAVLLRQEPKGRQRDQQDMDRIVGQAKDGKSGRGGAVQFTIEDGNHAKTCR